MPQQKLYRKTDLERRSGRPPVLETERERSAFKKDYARLLHAPSFRRLQGKTQLFPGAESDFFRNRLTHSLEVAQIASGIADFLNDSTPKLEIDRDLVQFAALAHDLGHPPFGHNGEHALDDLMRHHGGFEGNAQTLHMLSCTERKLVKERDGSHSSSYGLDLTYRSLASVLKYDQPIPLKKKKNEGLAKGYYHVEQDLVQDIKARVAPGFKGKFKTVECWIMDIADDIAYSTYDLEDSLHAGFVNSAKLLAALFQDKDIVIQVSKETNKALVEFGYDTLQKDELWYTASELLDATDYENPTTTGYEGSLIGRGLDLVRTVDKSQLWCKDSLYRTLYTAERVGKLIHQVSIDVNKQFPALSKVKLQRDGLLGVEIFKHLNRALVIHSPKLAIVQYRGKDIVKRVFTAILESNGALLSDKWRQAFNDASDESGRRRVVCDFVAGMTDRYAVEYHDALFGEGKTMYAPI